VAARFPFKGGWQERSGGAGGGEVRRCTGQSGGERGGPGRGGKWLGRPASAPGRRVRVAALPRYSGGRRDAHVTDASG
jgi:hypothetical protein